MEGRHSCPPATPAICPGSSSRRESKEGRHSCRPAGRPATPVH